MIKIYIILNVGLFFSGNQILGAVKKSTCLSPFSRATPLHTLHSGLPKTEHCRVDISGLDKRELLIALYKKASNKNLSLEAAQLVIEEGHGDIDYLYTTPMKIFIAGKTMNTSLFNREYGKNAVEDVIKGLKQTK